MTKCGFSEVTKIPKKGDFREPISLGCPVLYLGDYDLFGDFRNLPQIKFVGGTFSCLLWVSDSIQFEAENWQLVKLNAIKDRIRACHWLWCNLILAWLSSSWLSKLLNSHPPEKSFSVTQQLLRTSQWVSLRLVLCFSVELHSYELSFDTNLVLKKNITDL